MKYFKVLVLILPHFHHSIQFIPNYTNNNITHSNMVKRNIVIHSENKEEVFSYFARTMTFNQYEKLPENVKEEYLEWSRNTFLRERDELLKQRLFEERKERLLKKKQMEEEATTKVPKNWITKIRILFFSKDST